MELFTEADHLAEARYRKLLREQPGFLCGGGFQTERS